MLAVWPTVGSWGEWAAAGATAAAVYVAVRQNRGDRAERRAREDRRIIRDVEEALVLQPTRSAMVKGQQAYEYVLNVKNRGPRPLCDLVAEGELWPGGPRARSTTTVASLAGGGDSVATLRIVFADVDPPPPLDNVYRPLVTMTLTTSE